MTGTSKVLHSVRVFRSRDGGHAIEYHFMSPAHKPELHKFKKGEEHRASAHLLDNIGLPHPQIEEQEGSEPESWMSRGTSRGSRIEGKPRRGVRKARLND